MSERAAGVPGGERSHELRGALEVDAVVARGLGPAELTRMPLDEGLGFRSHEEASATTRTSAPLGELFREWNVRLDAACIGGYRRPAAPIVVFVEGRRRRGNPATIELPSEEEMAVVIGIPPSSIPATFDDPSGA